MKPIVRKTVSNGHFVDHRCDAAQAYAAFSILTIIRASDWALTKNGAQMSDTTFGLDQTEERMLAHEVSDEAFESASGTARHKAGNYTLYFCTALDLCPGP